MERQLWKSILEVLRSVDKPRYNTRDTFSPQAIVKVWMWAVIHDRPVSWACRAENWPPYERKVQLPSNSTMSRRLRSQAIRYLLKQIEQRVLRTTDSNSLVWMIDGKPLVISGCSKDRQAGYGRAASSKARGSSLNTPQPCRRSARRRSAR